VLRLCKTRNAHLWGLTYKGQRPYLLVEQMQIVLAKDAVYRNLLLVLGRAMHLNLMQDLLPLGVHFNLDLALTTNFNYFLCVFASSKAVGVTSDAPNLTVRGYKIKRRQSSFTHFTAVLQYYAILRVTY